MRFFCLLFCLLVVTLSPPIASAALVDERTSFELESANRQFDEISIGLSTHNLNVDIFSKAVEDLSELRDGARECIAHSQAQIKILDRILESEELKAMSKAGSDDLDYIAEKKGDYSQKLADCRLFTFRAEEALNAYNKILSSLSSSQTFERSTPIWGSFNSSNDFYFDFNLALAYEMLGMQFVYDVDLFLLASLLLIMLLPAFFVWRAMTRLSKNNRFYKMGLHFYLFPILSLSAMSLAFLAALPEYTTSPGLLNAIYACNAYIAARLSVKMLFLLIDRHEKGSRNDVMYRRFSHIASVTLLGYIASLLLDGQSISPELYDLLRTVFITVLSMMVILSCWVSDYLEEKASHPFFGTAVKVVLSVLLAILITTEWIGYHALSIYLLMGLLLSAVNFLFVWIALQLTDVFIALWSSSTNIVGRTIRKRLKIAPGEGLPELVIFRIVLWGGIWAVATLNLIRIWGGSPLTIGNLESALVKGVLISGSTISPLKIAFGMTVLTILLILNRIASAYIAYKHRVGGDTEAEAQVALASLFSYLGFFFSLMFAIFISGIDFGKILLIVGGLSVGMGFGLQEVVHNFTSGMIILIQKYIKPGDRILFNGTEAFVEKVRILTTRIKTLDQSDIIVPNSQITSSAITNYMYDEPIGRVKVEVGVAYGSDVEKVKRLMLEVASQHPGVYENIPYKPKIYFLAFSDSALSFELWAIIKEINQRYQIVSDLYTSIDKIFRENDIVIAFPQRDLHIVEKPPAPVQATISTS